MTTIRQTFRCAMTCVFSGSKSAGGSQPNAQATAEGRSASSSTV